MTTEYQIWLTDEIAGAQIDLGATTTITTGEEKLLRDLPFEWTGDTFHRLENHWQGFEAGTLVLYDGQEAMVFLVGLK